MRRTSAARRCWRTRRAMSWVYCPPKSSTTIPPRSAFGTGKAALTPAAIGPPSFEIAPSCDNKVHQFIWNHNSLDHLLAVEQLRHARLGDCQRGQRFFAQPDLRHNFSAHFSVQLNSSDQQPEG